MRAYLVLLTVASLITPALAHPPPEPEERVSWRETPALLEYSTWVRLGGGIAYERIDVIARATEPQPVMKQSVVGDVALGADVSLPVTRRLRIGAWGELQGLSPAGGLELLVTGAPAKLDMFWYEGEGVWIVRGGGTRTHATVAIGRGYRAPWKLWGPYDRTDRYEIGARIVVAGTRAYDDPQDWSLTMGLEFEPVGALRYVLGIKSWY